MCLCFLTLKEYSASPTALATIRQFVNMCAVCSTLAHTSRKSAYVPTALFMPMYCNILQKPHYILAQSYQLLSSTLLFFCSPPTQGKAYSHRLVHLSTSCSVFFNLGICGEKKYTAYCLTYKGI